MTELRVEQLSKSFGKQFVLDIPHLHIQPGSLVGVVGNNGAGKTTLFRLMCDLIRADHGNIFMEGLAVAGNDHWKSLAGIFLDEGFLIDFFTPEEFFYFTGNIYGLTSGQVDEKLLRFHRFMGEEVLGQKKYIRDLSTGNKQKVGIVAAMMTEPRVLILDEPFNYLDPSSQIIIKRMIKQDNESKGTTMLISSHNLNHLTDICNRVVLLERGKILKDLSPPNDDLNEVETYFSNQAE